MTLTLLDTLQILETLGTAAVDEGMMPGGIPAMVLSGLVAGLHFALKSGVLAPGAPIEIDDIGETFDAAVARMRAALAAGKETTS